jgi:TMEM175 potassium channel family protein
VPTAVYGGLQLCAGFAYSLLQWSILRSEGHNSTLAAAIGTDIKGRASVGAYAVAVAFVNPVISDTVYVAVALMWFVPDRRIEQLLNRT